MLAASPAVMLPLLIASSLLLVLRWTLAGAAHARVEEIAQRVAEHVGGVDYDREAQARRQRQPRPVEHESPPAARQHPAPGGRRRRHTESKERQCRLGNDDDADAGREQHDDRGEHVGREAGDQEATGGGVWRTRMRGVEGPIDCAACTYMFSRTLTTAERMMREPAIPSSRPSVTIICGMPGPTTDTATISTMRTGKLCQASTKRCVMRSTLPPRYPVTIPMTTEMRVARPAAQKPKMTESWAP